MFLRGVLILAGGAVIALTLLSLRQERLELAHDMVQIHREIDRSRQDLWQLQSELARQTDPQHLREQIVQAQLALEPTAAPVAHPILLVNKRHESR